MTGGTSAKFVTILALVELSCFLITSWSSDDSHSLSISISLFLLSPAFPLLFTCTTFLDELSGFAFVGVSVFFTASVFGFYTFFTGSGSLS